MRYGFARDVVILILGVMLFKFSMDNSGAVAGLSSYFTARQIPLLPTLLFLPFVSGLLTGITVGFVGGTFPVLLSIAGGASSERDHARFRGRICGRAAFPGSPLPGSHPGVFQG